MTEVFIVGDLARPERCQIRAAATFQIITGICDASLSLVAERRPIFHLRAWNGDTLRANLATRPAAFREDYPYGNIPLQTLIQDRTARTTVPLSTVVTNGVPRGTRIDAIIMDDPQGGPPLARAVDDPTRLAIGATYTTDPLGQDPPPVRTVGIEELSPPSARERIEREWEDQARARQRIVEGRTAEEARALEEIRQRGRAARAAETMRATPQTGGQPQAPAPRPWDITEIPAVSREAQNLVEQARERAIEAIRRPIAAEWARGWDGFAQAVGEFYAPEPPTQMEKKSKSKKETAACPECKGTGFWVSAMTGKSKTKCSKGCVPK